MKEKTKYLCDFCGTEYASCVDCQKCEENHKQPKKIVSTKYYPKSMNEKGYPQNVAILMSDGTKVIYEYTAGRE